jgi:hypothetical protein
MKSALRLHRALHAPNCTLALFARTNKLLKGREFEEYIQAINYISPHLTLEKKRKI